MNQKICDRCILHKCYHWKWIVFKHQATSTWVPHETVTAIFICTCSNTVYMLRLITNNINTQHKYYGQGGHYLQRQKFKDFSRTFKNPRNIFPNPVYLLHNISDRHDKWQTKLIHTADDGVVNSVTVYLAFFKQLLFGNSYIFTSVLIPVQTSSQLSVKFKEHFQELSRTLTNEI